MNYYKGNFYQDYKDEKETKNGWLVGRFMDGYRHSEEMCIKFWQFKKGEEKTHSMKYEIKAVECNILLEGEVRGIVDGNEIIFKAGEYIVIPPQTKNNIIIEVLKEPVKGFTVKAPSMPKEDSVKL
jgi:quercetin dioxygenase-like cupin family protein